MEKLFGKRMIDFIYLPAGLTDLTSLVFHIQGVNTESLKFESWAIAVSTTNHSKKWSVINNSYSAFNFTNANVFSVFIIANLYFPNERLLQNLSKNTHPKIHVPLFPINKIYYMKGCSIINQRHIE